MMQKTIGLIGLALTLARVGVACGCKDPVGSGAGDELTTIVSAKSPDGRNEIRLYASPLSYEVLRDGETVVGRSRIGLKIDGHCLMEGSCLRTVSDRSLTGKVGTPVYKKESVDLTQIGRFADFGDWGVCIVARNDGLAYRFETALSGEISVDGEQASVAVPSDARALVYKTTTIGWEEAVPEVCRVGDVRTVGDEVVYLPLVYTANGTTVAVTESDLCDYPCWYLKRENGPFESFFPHLPKKTHYKGGVDEKARGRWQVVDEVEDCLARTTGTRTFPWRTFILADEPSKMCESDIVYALARPGSGDFSWVRPGKVAWDWWNAFDNLGDPEGCTTKTYERFIDFAAKYGIEYVILDEGWSEKLNIWKFHPNVDVLRLLGYAKKRNVGIILWMAWAQVVGDEAHVAEHFAKLGVSGFKVDFMDRADADVERFLWTFAEECAKRKLLIDYHGMHRPTGLSRTYPNVVNYEGVHGLEQMKFYRGQDMMLNDVAAFFGRMTAGPLDYTPGAMDNYPIGKYPRGDAIPRSKRTTMYMNPGSIGTRCHQMAMMVMYEAPLQMLADAPTKYEKNLECFRFMASMPVVWKDTVGLGGTFDTYAACARKGKDDSWLVAVLNGSVGRDVEISTAFLGAGEWKMEIFCDADDAGVSPTHYLHEEKKVVTGKRLKVELAPGGGCVVRFSRISEGQQL